MTDRKLKETIALAISVAHMAVGLIIILFAFMIGLLGFTESTTNFFYELGFGAGLFGAFAFVSYGIYTIIKAVRN